MSNLDEGLLFNNFWPFYPFYHIFLKTVKDVKIEQNPYRDGRATKCNSVFNTRKCFGLWNSHKNVHSVWCVEYDHKINCEPMGTEIRGGMNEYKRKIFVYFVGVLRIKRKHWSTISDRLYKNFFWDSKISKNCLKFVYTFLC